MYSGDEDNECCSIRFDSTKKNQKSSGTVLSNKIKLIRLSSIRSDRFHNQYS